MPTGGIEASRTDATGDLTYTTGTGRYTFAWKTDSGWAGTCRQLLLEVLDMLRRD